LDDGSYRLGVLRDSSYFDNFNVWGRKYFWPDYVFGVGLVWGGSNNALTTVFWSVITSKPNEILRLFNHLKRFRITLCHTWFYSGHPLSSHITRTSDK
jgi:hypothetical protein